MSGSGPEGSAGRTPERRRGWQLLVKRGLDVLVAGAALVAASPLLAIAALAIRLEDGGPVFFAQERAGRGGRPFGVRKLRSMRVNQRAPETMGRVTSEHELVTRVGAALRRTKVDELPQLWNVLRGQMSLVGPRPTLPALAEQYDAFRRRRLEVRPGLSGWAQVNGNTALSWDDRIALDVWYIDHWSLGLDLRILARTVAVVLGGEKTRSTALEEARRHAKRAGWSG